MDTATPGGYVCRWSAPYGWPQAPVGWFPDARWRPATHLPYEPDYRWWRVETLPGVHDFGRNDPSYIKLVLDTLDLERAFPDTPAFFAEIAPTVWTAPAHWPSAPRGWTPPTGWRPDPSWGPAPHGWQFDQPDRLWVHENLERRDGVFLLGPTGIETLLNRIEDYVAWSVASVERLRELSRSLEQLDPGSTLAPSELQSLHQAQDDVVGRAGTARTYVLYALFSIGEFDGWFRHVRTELAAAVQRQFHAARPVIHRLGEIGLSVVSQDQYPEEARTRVYDLYMQSSALLRTHSPFSSDRDDDGDGSASLPGSAPWQLAEELAATELRRRGFHDAQRTPPGADGGFDVEGRGVVAQVKYLAAPVGREAIQRLAGANTHKARMAFFSRSGYTRTAREFADAADVALFTLSVDDDAVDAVNDSGERLWA